MAKFLLFPYLRLKCDKSNLLALSSYKKYYDENNHYLGDYPYLRKFDKALDPLSLIKTCVYLEALNNKLKIEGDAELYQEANLKTSKIQDLIHNRLPYCLLDGEKIFVPFFPPIYNRPYDKGLTLLVKQPYLSLKKDFENALVSPFDTYGYNLFDSYFTNLILIRKSDDLKSAAFYSIEMEMILIINDQGLLEEQINLFDTVLLDRRKAHLFDRLNVLVEDYYKNDHDKFISDLYKLNFLSKDTYDYIVEKEKNRG